MNATLGPFAQAALDDLDAATRRELARALEDGPKPLANVGSAGGTPES